MAMSKYRLETFRIRNFWKEVVHVVNVDACTVWLFLQFGKRTEQAAASAEAKYSRVICDLV